MCRVHRHNLRGTRGTGTLTFWTEGYRTPTFQEVKVKNLVSTEAICAVADPEFVCGGMWSTTSRAAVGGVCVGVAPSLQGGGQKIVSILDLKIASFGDLWVLKSHAGGGCISPLWIHHWICGDKLPVQ